ncbi:MAG: hypothetical protein ACOC9E_03550 [Chloroflexota bacterium]
MEFEEMQMIWNSQDEKRMFAIDEDALHEVIKGKSRSASRWLGAVEWMMIVLNPIVAVVLAYDAVAEGGPTYQFVIAAMYLAYSGVGVYRRLARRKEEVHFDESMLGDLEKAIWRVDYLIKLGGSLIVWYLAPLALVASAFFLLAGNVLEGGLMLLILPATYLAVRWENGKWHLPKKRSLESLRETLRSAEVEEV